MPARRDAPDGARVLVGRFGAAHGVRGEIRLVSFTGEPAAIARYKPLSDDRGRLFTLTSLRPVKDNIFVVRIDGVDDRNAAEALVNRDLYVPRDVLPPAEEDEFYVTDLIGLAAIDEDEQPIGHIVDVVNYGGGDILEIAPADGVETLLLPFTKAVVPTVDFARRRVVVIPPVETETSDLPPAEA